MPYLSHVLLWVSITFVPQLMLCEPQLGRFPYQGDTSIFREVAPRGAEFQACVLALTGICESIFESNRTRVPSIHCEQHYDSWIESAFQSVKEVVIASCVYLIVTQHEAVNRWFHHFCRELLRLWRRLNAKDDRDFGRQSRSEESDLPRSVCKSTVASQSEPMTSHQPMRTMRGQETTDTESATTREWHFGPEAESDNDDFASVMKEEYRQAGFDFEERLAHHWRFK